jgi:thiol-disulfide isomerase/thioredoxin
MADAGRGVKRRWRALRANKWAALVFDTALLILVFVLINAWQARNLPSSGPAPALDLAWLDGMQADRSIEPGQVGVVYFFAPWCFYCRHSIGNLDELLRSDRVGWARAVALDYSDPGEVRDFVERTGVHLPVMLGTAKTFRDWHIRAYPTYFVIGADGRIASRSVGYSTSVGLRLRLLLAALKG